MKIKNLSAIFWPGLLALICTASASAQLSTTLGDNFSLPLDNNLNGLDSAVAPGIVYEVAPGALNLMTPDEHLLPYDAIGASIVATPLNPSVTQLFVVSRIPFQLDNSVRDSTMLTGQLPRLPIDIVETLRRRTGNTEFGSLSPKLPASTFSSALPSRNALPSLSPVGMTPPGGSSILSRTVYPQSSWRAGSGNSANVAAELDINSAQIQSTQPSGQVSDSNSSGASHLLDQERSNRSAMYANGSPLSENRRQAYPSGSQLSQQPSDNSRSPLESVAVMGTDSAGLSENPLESFGQKSLLNPDITLAAQRRSSTKKTRTSLNTRAESSSWQSPSPFAARTQSDPLRSRRTPSGSIMAMREADVTRADARRMKQSSIGQQANKSRWHNPILQQMEGESAATGGIR